MDRCVYIRWLHFSNRCLLMGIYLIFCMISNRIDIKIINPVISYSSCLLLILALGLHLASLVHEYSVTKNATVLVSHASAYSYNH